MFLFGFLSNFLGNEGVILAIFSFVLIGGLVVEVYPGIKNMHLKQIGWGLLYGSLSIMFIAVGLLLLFIFH